MKDGRNHPRRNEADVEAAAAAWLVRSGEDMDAVTAAEFGEWCAADARHAAALARLSQAEALLKKLPQLRRDPRLLGGTVTTSRESAGPVGRSRPHFWRPLAGVAAGLALAAAGWWLWPAPSADRQSYATGAEGYRRAELPDGSVVELNADSRIELRFTAAERRVILRAGEGHFKVAKNPARPFIVTAGRVQVRAVGTMFDVRRDARQVHVLVTEGKVAVATGAGEREPTKTEESLSPDTSLVAGQRLRIATDAPMLAMEPETVAPEEIRAALAWQDQQMVFVDTPLSDIVRRFNRRNAVQLVIGDAILAGRPVGGTFQADNVEAFVRLLEATNEIAAERMKPGYIILHKIPTEPRR